MNDDQIQDLAKMLFIKRIIKEPITWPRNMRKPQRIIFLDKLIQFAEDNSMVDEIITISEVKKRLQEKK